MSGNGIITFGEALILGEAIICLRMSDFRDEDVRTFGERERQLRDFAAGLGVPAGRVRVAIENDAGNGGYRPASAYKRPVRVTTATGLVTMRTRRPVFARVLLDLQTGKAGVLICDDVSRIARDERDALRWRNAHARHPDVLAAQRRERARIRSERQQRWGRPKPKAA